MATRKKLGTVKGVADWSDLKTTGDCQRLLRWLILSLRDGTLNRAEASVMGLLASYLMKSVESDFETKFNAALSQWRQTPPYEAAPAGRGPAPPKQ